MSLFSRLLLTGCVWMCIYLCVHVCDVKGRLWVGRERTLSFHFRIVWQSWYMLSVPLEHDSYFADFNTILFQFFLNHTSVFVIFIFGVSCRIRGELGKSCRGFVSCSVFKLASRACILSLSCTSVLWREQEEQNRFSIKCNWKATCLFTGIFPAETKIKST